MEWISVDQKLPEKYQRVIVLKFDVCLICVACAIYNGNDFLFDATMINKSKYFEKVSDRQLTGITHWTPLLKIPKE